MLEVLICCRTLIIWNILLEIAELPVVWSIWQRWHLFTLWLTMVWHDQMVLLNLKQFLLNVSLRLILGLIISFIWAALTRHVLVQKMLIKSLISIICLHLTRNLQFTLRTASNFDFFVCYLREIECQNRFLLICLLLLMHLLLDLFLFLLG